MSDICQTDRDNIIVKLIFEKLLQFDTIMTFSHGRLRKIGKSKAYQNIGMCT